MAGPITWRNIEAPDLRGAGILLNNTQFNLQQSFKALGDILAKQEQTNTANFQNDRNNNTQDRLDQLQGFRTAEELLAARDSGQLDSLFRTQGQNVDREALRGMFDKRLADLQKQATDGIQYNLTMRQDRERELVDGLLLRAQQGDTQGALQEVGKADLLNNAEVAGKIQGIRRDFTQDGYKANQEKRAQASHGMNMQVSRANLDWANYSRNRQKSADARQDFGSDLVNSRLIQLQQQQQQDAEITNQLAPQFGGKVVNGVFDDSAMSDEQKQQFAAALRERGVGQGPTATQTAQQLDELLRMNPDHRFTPNEVQVLKQALTQGITGSRTLQAPEQEYLDSRLAAVEGLYKQNIEQETDSFNKLSMTNIFLRGVNEPNLTADDVVKSLKSNEFDPMFFEGTNKDQLLETAQRIMSKGVNIKGIHREVPPAVLKYALATNADDWFDPSDGLEESIKNLIENNWEDYDKGIDALKEHKEEIRKINEGKLRQAGRIEQEVRGQNGLGINTRKLLEQLERRAK